MVTDPIADMLTRIRNANKALHESARMPTSKMKVEIARLLKEEGYIKDYRVERGETFDVLVVDLKYGRSRERILTDLKRVSSTPQGLVTSRTAEKEGIGGEVVCFVW